MSRILFTGFLIFFLTACVDRAFYKSYVDQVDKLSQHLEEMAVKYESLDTLLIRAQYDTIRRDLDSLSRIPDIVLDTLVTNYKYIGKDYKTFWRGHPLTMQELDYTRSQLRNLRHDIGKYYLDEKSVVDYFIQEKESVRKLRDRMDYNRVLILKGMRQFAETRPRIKSLLDSLSNTKTSETK